ncbi:helix-turn-helix transcriptional regulator [Acrocarpospora sp. B8E8]|uniref:helix-turn-helix domain-containing protein n=1 Tax=Acrocarpospora sp. B8E8 TaxID=3153572 RepID=UPI00325D1668
MSRASERVDPGASPWHLLGAAIRHWREDVRGVTLQEVAKQTYSDHGDLSKWERGLVRPHSSVVERLDSALNAKGHLVALHGVVTDLDRFHTLETKTPVPQEDATERRRLLQIAAANLTLGLVGGSEPVRQLLDQDHARSIEEWEISRADHLHALRTRPPAQVAADLAIDLLALERQMKIAKPAEIIELQRVLAALSAVHANALTRLADHGAAIRWWRTARRAADASGDLSLDLLIRGQEAAHGLYGQRSPETVLHLVRSAQQLTSRPNTGLTTTGASLMATEAKALSMIGRHGEALAVMHSLTGLAETIKGDPLGFWKPDQIHFAASWINAAAGRESHHDAQRDTVLALTTDYVYGTNVILHRALCTVANGGIEEGTRLAAAVIADSPAAYRSSHVLETARMVLRAIPLAQRNFAAVRELSEVLAIDPPKT